MCGRFLTRPTRLGIQNSAVIKALIKKAAHPRLLRFGMVGLSGVPVNLGMLWLFSDNLGWPLALASPLAIEISIIWNFLLNDTWTFSDRKADASAHFFKRMYRYNVVSLVGLAIQVGAAFAMNQVFMKTFELTEPGIWKYPAQMVGIAVAMSWNFLSNFYFTWAQKKPAETPQVEAGPPAEVPAEAEPVGEPTRP